MGDMPWQGDAGSLQNVGRHFSEPLLLELARVLERERPWPLTTLSNERIS